MSFTKDDFDKVLQYINDNPNYTLGIDLAMGIYEFTVYEIEQELVRLKYVLYDNNRYKITGNGKQYLLSH